MTSSEAIGTSLVGKVALITGAGSGLGAAFARRLAHDGATVIVNDLSTEAVAAVADQLNADLAIFDVSNADDFDRSVDQVVARHGKIDIMINNAGIAPPVSEQRFERGLANQLLRMEGRISEMAAQENVTTLSNDEWDRMIRVHLYGAFYGTRAALRHMQLARSGAIVNISSVLGLNPSGSAAHYAAAKAGVIALTKSAALETAHLGIRINAVCPGFIDTPLLSGFNEILRSSITMRIASGRMGDASEVAELVRFLVGPESSYCTGDVFSASGGYA